MRAVFAHDHRFTVLDGKVYSPGKLPAAVWSRYLKSFGQIVVAARARPGEGLDELASMNLSSAPGVSFEFLPDPTGGFLWIGNRGAARERLKPMILAADAVIARLPSEIGLLACDLAKEAGRPYAVEVVACPWDGYRAAHRSWIGRLYAPLARARVAAAVAVAPYALYVTEHFLQERYPNVRGETINISNVEIDTPDPVVLARRLERVASNVSKARPLVFGLIGSLETRAKGIQTALAALAAVRANLPPFEFRILGNGSATPWRDLASRHGLADLVRFDPPRPAGASVMAWLDEVDIYLQPSLQEGLPRSLIEAMSRGCPALGTRCAGIPELLPPEYLVAVGDAQGLATALLSLASDVDRQKNAAVANWTRAKAYSSDRLNQRRSRFWDSFADFARREGDGEHAGAG